MERDLLEDRPEMIGTMTITSRSGPAFEADTARVRVRVSYLLGRWVQAPISPAREADT